MAFDEALAERVREALVGRAEVSERKMFGGRPAKNMVFVDSGGTATDEDLAAWVDAGADYASSLPPK